LRGEFELFLPPPSIPDIQKAACEVFGVTRNELVGRSREARIAHARAIAVLVCRQNTDASLPRIGRAFNRHHATVHSLINRAQSLLDAVPARFDQYQAVLHRLQLGL
jgi:chromosomal replication initiator protein